MSLKQTIPAGSPGHKRRSRWLTGKFLVLFLAVATLLAGTALVAPQFQEKASAIDDGRDITWDVSGGQKAYDAMINAVRQRATGGRVLREGILQTDPSLDPNNPANVFAINLQASALPGSSDANSVRLIMRARDLFVIGYQVTGGRGPTNPHFLRGDAPGGMTGDPLNFTGSYTDLERVGRQERAGLKLTLEGMSTAYRTLRDDANENAVARSLMLFVMTIAEAARFDPLRQNFRGPSTPTAARPPSALPMRR